MLIKLRFKFMGGHSIFNLFSWEHRLSQKNSQDQVIRTMIDGSDPKCS